MAFPDTVISLAVEPKAQADRDRLVEVLARLSRDDPTFKVRVDDQTGQMLISGMGELHLEVICNRLVKDFKIPVNLGKPRVAFKQTVARQRRAHARYERQGSGGPEQFAVVELLVEPAPGVEGVEFEVALEGGVLPAAFVAAVERSVKAAAAAGGSYGFPFTGLRVALVAAEMDAEVSTEMAFEAAAAEAFSRATDDNAVLLEPIMRIEIETPESATGEVIGDLTSRRGVIESMTTQPGGICVIDGQVPLSEMFQYTTTLRSLTQGHGHSAMEPVGYEPVPPEIRERLLPGW